MIIYNCNIIFEHYYVNFSVELVMRQINEATHILTNAIILSANLRDYIKHILNINML